MNIDKRKKYQNKTKKPSYKVEKTRGQEVIKKNLDKIRKETEFISQENKLMKNPSSIDEMDKINKKYEKAFEDTIINTKNELSSLLNLMKEKLSIINWISTRNKDFIWKDGKIKWLTQKISLENVIFSGQKLSIKNLNWKRENVVWWKDINWDMTYVIEWTNKRVYLENGFQISNYEEKNEVNFEKNKNSKKSINKVVHSNPSEKSKNWITLCSRTAHKNLQKLWVNSRRWNAVDVMRSYGKNLTIFPFGEWKIIDLFVKTKSVYGHRAAAFFNNWQCYVLDPYYPVMNGKRTTAPIPYEIYSKWLQSMWRKVIWWVALA